MENLTLRQEAILEFIAGFFGKKKSPPTVREIQAHFRFGSPNAVTGHLSQLEKKGYLKRRPGVARGIELLSRSISFHPEVRSVPVLGRVAAGSPILAEENIEGYLHLDKTLLRGDGHFLLKVRGDSMTGAGICENDFVLVKKQDSAESGDIVVAYLGGEAAVKRYKRRERMSELHSENPVYPAIKVDLEKYPDFRILGKVKAVLRIL